LSCPRFPSFSLPLFSLQKGKRVRNVSPFPLNVVVKRFYSLSPSEVLEKGQFFLSPVQFAGEFPYFLGLYSSLEGVEEELGILVGFVT